MAEPTIIHDPEIKPGKKICEACTEVEITTDNMNAINDMIVCSECVKEMREYQQPPATPEGEVLPPEFLHWVSTMTTGGHQPFPEINMIPPPIEDDDE